MKRLLLILTLFTLARVAAHAQDEDVGQTDPNARERIKAARVAYITQRLNLTPDEAARFWPIYQEFAARREALRQQLEDARAKPDPNETAEQRQQALLNLGLEIDQKELELKKEYSARFLQTITAEQLMNLRRAEEEFRNLLLRQLQQRQIDQQRREQLRDRIEEQRRERNN